MTFLSRFRCLSLLGVILALSVHTALAVAPDNDDFANPHPLDTSSTDSSTTVEATLASGEVIP